MEYRRLEQLFFCNENDDNNNINNNSKRLEEEEDMTSSSLSSSLPSSTTTTLSSQQQPQQPQQPQQQQQPLATIQIGNWTLQQLHVAPNIYMIDNFLSSTELDYFQQKIHKGGFQRSYVDIIGNGHDEDDNDDDNNNDTGNVTSTTCNDNDNNDDNDKDQKRSTPFNKNKNNNKARRHHHHYNDSCSQESTYNYCQEHRTSTFLSFQKQQDRIISLIEQRAATLLGCWSPITCIEPIQLVRYETGQFFHIHHDLGDYNEETGHVVLPPKSWFVKRRLVTIFCYLNNLPTSSTPSTTSTTTSSSSSTLSPPDDHQASCSTSTSSTSGGETYFPQASQLTISPKKGRAILFCNILSNGQPDPRTIHAGKVVTQGIKYGLNIWICES